MSSARFPLAVRRRSSPRFSVFSLVTPLALLAFALFPAPLFRPVHAADLFGNLTQRLLQDGFSRDHVSAIFSPEPEPAYERVVLSLRTRESRLNYDQFLKPDAVEQAERFLREHRHLFKEVEERYGVDPYVVAGLLLVETRCGEVTGRIPVLETFVTFALMEDPVHRNHVWERLPASDRRRLGRTAFEEKLKNRSRWAYGELYALLQWTQGEPDRTRGLRGSFMGAIGWPQFLPSSILHYGVDGDGDGRINLFEPADTLHSVGNYLKSFGWNRAQTRDDRTRVLLYYNRSRPYAATILEVADLLRKRTDLASASRP
jgi:membrane-bound lytic murein transglycosylase B